MPDYIYLLENRLSQDQQNALRHIREAALDAGMVLFLTGDAVRDLTSGHAVRDVEVAVHGNALKLKKNLIKSGAKVWGEDEESRTLYLCFPGTVRVDIASTLRVEYPKPGKPVYHPASIQEELRRRDFTVNAMAISLNEGSYGLLMDPLNGVADVETRTLRLVSNYGFIEDPSLLLRAIRYTARLGWEMDPRTKMRYDNAKEEGTINALSATSRSRELEQIGHEDDGLKVLHAYESEGWMKHLFPAWTSAKADEPKLRALHDLAVELLLQGVHSDISAAQMQLLTAKLQGKDLSALKKLMLRPGFVEEWDSLDNIAAAFLKTLTAKENATASAGYKLFMSYDPEAILWLGFTNKTSAVQKRYEQFLKVWPTVRQQIPYALMQEMRITQDLSNYKELIHNLFLQMIDGKLTTPEEMKAFLEPYSPPPPPPQVTYKRTRVKRAEAKLKEVAYDDDAEDNFDDDEDGFGSDDEDVDSFGSNDEDDRDDEAEDEEHEKPSAKRGKAPKPVAKPKVEEKAAKIVTPVKAEPVKAVVAAKSVAKPVKAASPVKAPVAKPMTKKPEPKPVKPAVKSEKKVVAKAPVKKAPVKAAKAPAKKPVAKQTPKSVKKVVAKAPVKKAVKPSKPVKPAKKAVKPIVKKAAKPSKPVKKVAKKR